MKKFLRLIAPSLIAAIFAVTLTQAAVWQWSHTASSNDRADASIDWSEGMSPSSVNDSARAMMARLADYRDDISGLLTTGGTATAYTVTTNQGLNSPPQDGQLLVITVHATNGASSTLSADSGTAFAIQSSAGAAVASCTLVAGSPYALRYSTANTAWMLRGFYANPFSVPLGVVMDFTGTVSPNSNFVFPIGQCVSRTTYSTYFAMVATRYGVCDGTTTFGIPNMAGQILAANDSLSGSARGFITTAGSACDGSTLGTACGAQNRTIAQANLPNVNFTVNLSGVTYDRVIISTHAKPGTPNDTNTNFPSGYTTPNLTGSATAASGGSGTALATIPPIQIVNKIIRIF